jgi:hypothetical protein
MVAQNGKKIVTPNALVGLQSTSNAFYLHLDG